MITDACTASDHRVRLSGVLATLGIARSVWYAKAVSKPKKPVRKPKAVPEVLALARRYPWWGYKRIAVIARRQGLAAGNKMV